MPSGMSEQREGAHPPAVRRRQGRARRAARIGSAELSRAGHLHVLRHGQQQPGADGSDGPAPAGRGVRPAEHAAARCADQRRGPPRRAHHRARRRILPIAGIVDERAIVNAIVGLLATGGSTNHTLHLVAMARAAGMQHQLGRFQRPVRHRAAAGAHLSERRRRRESLPRRRRHRLPDPRAAELRAAARRHDNRDGHGRSRRVHARAVAVGRQPRVARRARDERRRERAAADARSVQRRRRAESPARQSRPRRHQDLRRAAAASRRRSARARVRRSGSGDRGVQGRRTVARLRRGRALPGTARQRHAGAAQAHADAQRRCRARATTSR